jgi:hypothetical protein
MAVLSDAGDESGASQLSYERERPQGTDLKWTHSRP